MSIFINNKVHLPSSCEKCPFNYADISAGICLAADKTIDTRTYGRKRHPDCPLVEIPTPHGRLIDADVLENGVAEWQDCCIFRDAQILCTVIDMIHKAPTIIEAEVSE